MENLGKFLRLKSLYIRNFMSHKEKLIDFSDSNVTMILGPNGSGKTAITEAIYIGLNIKKESRFNNFAEAIMVDEDEAEIDVVFETTTNHTVEIKSKLTPKYGKMMDMLIDEKNTNFEKTMIANTLESMDTEIILSNSLFRREDNKFMTLSPTQNYNNFYRNLNFEVVNDLIEKLNDALDTYQDNLQAATSNNNEWTKERAADLDTIKDLQRDLEETKLSLANASEEKIDEQAIKNLEDSIEKMKGAKKANESYERQMVSLNSSKTYAQNTLDKAKADLMELKDIPAWDKEKLEHDLEESKQKIVDLRADKTAKNIEYGAMDKEKETLKSHYDMIKDGHCPICNSNICKASLDEQIMKIRTLSRKLAGLKTTIESIDTSIATSKEKSKQIEDEISKKQEAGIKLAAKVDSTHSAIDRAQSDLDRIQKEISGLVKPEVTYTSEELEQKIREHSKMKSALENAQRIENMRSMYSRKVEDIKMYESSVRELDKRLEELKPKIDLLESQVSIIDKGLHAINLLAKNLTVYYFNYICTFMNNILEEFGYAIYFKISHDKKEVLYFLEKNGKRIKLNHCSSFERDLLCILMCISIAKLKNSKIMILDEPDQAASIENTTKLSDMLNKVLHDNILSQIIIITHNAITQNLVEGTNVYKF